jgi:hypothetical protein
MIEHGGDHGIQVECPRRSAKTLPDADLAGSDPGEYWARLLTIRVISVRNDLGLMNATVSQRSAGCPPAATVKWWLAALTVDRGCGRQGSETEISIGSF